MTATIVELARLAWRYDELVEGLSAADLASASLPMVHAHVALVNRELGRRLDAREAGSHV